jgi:uncharacterized protein YndB with AHSA1/START domain
MLKKLFTVTPFVALLCVVQLAAFSQATQDSASKHSATPDALKSDTIHQEVDFSAAPQRVYEALVNANEFSEFAAQSGDFTGHSATIDSAEGGAFILFDGHITGRNVELKPGKRIVQAWRTADWPEGIYSVIKFELTPQGSGTHLVFDQVGYPRKWHDVLSGGWKSHYWDPMIKYFH